MSLRHRIAVPTLVFATSALLGAGCLSPAEEAPARPVGNAEMQQIQTEDAIGPQVPGERVTVDIKQINKATKIGKPWNQEGGHRKIGPKGMDVNLGNVRHHKVVELQFGNAHSYWVRFFNGDEKVGEIRAWPKVGPDRDQMVFRELYPAPEIVSKGYDRLRIEPVSDRRYSIGAVLLREKKMHAKPGKPGAGKPGAGKPGAGKPGALKPAGAKPAGLQPKPAQPAGAKPAQPQPAQPKPAG